MYEYKSDIYGSHSKILELVDTLKRRGLKILDVGCAKGYLAERLSKKGHEITGIEFDPKSAKLAGKYCKGVIEGNIEKLDLRIKKNYFDLIIFGDILEHLKEPEPILKKYLKYLKRGGFVITSVPNIANAYIRLNLLLGRFDYTAKGILDKTHLRFYTLKTLKNLIKESDLKIIRMEVTPVPLPMVFPSMGEGGLLNIIHQINNLSTRLWKKLLGYQFVILAKK